MAEDAEQPPVKKRRGRPPKKRPPVEGAAAAGKAEVPALLQGSGDATAHRQSVLEAALADMPQATVDLLKPKRGRPPGTAAQRAKLAAQKAAAKAAVAAAKAAAKVAAKEAVGASRAEVAKETATVDVPAAEDPEGSAEVAAGKGSGSEEALPVPQQPTEAAVPTERAAAQAVVRADAVPSAAGPSTQAGSRQRRSADMRLISESLPSEPTEEAHPLPTVDAAGPSRDRGNASATDATMPATTQVGGDTGDAACVAALPAACLQSWAEGGTAAAQPPAVHPSVEVAGGAPNDAEAAAASPHAENSEDMAVNASGGGEQHAPPPEPATTAHAAVPTQALKDTSKAESVSAVKREETPARRPRGRPRKTAPAALKAADSKEAPLPRRKSDPAGAGSSQKNSVGRPRGRPRKTAAHVPKNAEAAATAVSRKSAPAAMAAPGEKSEGKKGTKGRQSSGPACDLCRARPAPKLGVLCAYALLPTRLTVKPSRHSDIVPWLTSVTSCAGCVIITSGGSGQQGTT